MLKRSEGKLNQLQVLLPDQLLVDAEWLERHGYSRSLRSQYVNSGWLHQPARRVYRRSQSPLTWQQVIVSLQTMLEYPLSVGGRSSLEAQGHGHYLSDHARQIHLYGPERPPSWLSDLPIDTKFRWHNSRRLFPDDPDQQPRNRAPVTHVEARPPGGYMLQSGGLMTWPIAYSVPERAILEMLDELPDHESFHQADMMMEGLPNLSPQRLQKLLTDCRSVKVKRLFFFFADRHRHAWLAKLDKDAIDLGAGKRSLVTGGKLDPHYLITVPVDMAEDDHGLR